MSASGMEYGLGSAMPFDLVSLCLFLMAYVSVSETESEKASVMESGSQYE